MERRLYLLAGMLEIADREFAAVASDVDSYSASVREKARSGQLDVEVDSTSVSAFISKFTKPVAAVIFATRIDPTVTTVVIEELRALGISHLSRLAEIFSKTSWTLRLGTRVGRAMTACCEVHDVSRPRQVLRDGMEEPLGGQPRPPHSIFSRRNTVQAASTTSFGVETFMCMNQTTQIFSTRTTATSDPWRAVLPRRLLCMAIDGEVEQFQEYRTGLSDRSTPTSCEIVNDLLPSAWVGNIAA
jgi:hypothetical protein